MTVFNKDEIKELAREQKGPCISIFMTTFKRGADVAQNPVRLKNLVREAAKKLAAQGYTNTEKILEPAQSLLLDPRFKNQPQDGLAIFLADNQYHYFNLPERMEQQVIVSNRFYIKPLLKLITDNKNFYLLSLDQKAIHLYKASPFYMEEIEVENIPKTLEEALQIDESEQKKYRESEGGGARKAAFYSGPSAGTDDQKHNREIQRFFQKIDKGIFDTIKEEHYPMLLAGVEFVTSLFRSASSYSAIIEQTINGNPEDMGKSEIFKRAREIMTPYFESELTEALSHYGEYLKNNRSSDNPAEIIAGAYSGRVSDLFVLKGSVIHGTFNPETFEVDTYSTKDGEDLIDFSILQTIAHDGRVYTLDSDKMPGASQMAALFRY